MRHRWRMSQPPKRRIEGVAERAKSRRLQRKLSQQVTATRAGMSINRLRDLERYGLATPDTLARLARALETSVDELTGRKGGAS
jgi:transcriptional regulator with XRE-family HTH domain